MLVIGESYGCLTIRRRCSFDQPVKYTRRDLDNKADVLNYRWIERDRRQARIDRHKGAENPNVLQFLKQGVMGLLK